MMSEQELRDLLSKYKFYHIIPLTENVSTPGSMTHVKSQQPVLEAIRQLEVSGKRVLDVGCRDGLYSLEVEKLGAKEIVGFDNDLSYGAVNVVLPFLKSKVQMHEMNVLDLLPSTFGKFDIIVFAGVLYHLRYPFWTLKLLADVANPGCRMVLETAIFYSSSKHAMMYCPTGTESPYEASSCTFFNQKGLTDSLQSIGWDVHSVSLLHPDAADKDGPDGAPVIDRAVWTCEYVGMSDEKLNHYWNKNHDIHKRFGGDDNRVRESKVLVG
jgi:SAM-dependent methyltransferase